MGEETIPMFRSGQRVRVIRSFGDAREGHHQILRIVWSGPGEYSYVVRSETSQAESIVPEHLIVGSEP